MTLSYPERFCVIDYRGWRQKYGEDKKYQNYSVKEYLDYWSKITSVAKKFGVKLVTDTQKQVEEQDSQSLAAAIALRKAVQNYGIRHSISFHRTIKGASDFAELHKKLNDCNVDGIYLNSKHISSKKSAGERASLMTDFVQESPALMTNARCLTEGVDVPAIDCVLFADPKQSKIDIVQSSGRALRPFVGK